MKPLLFSFLLLSLLRVSTLLADVGINKTLTIKPSSPSASWTVSVPFHVTARLTVDVLRDENGCVLKDAPAANPTPEKQNFLWTGSVLENSQGFEANYSVVNNGEGADSTTLRVTCTWVKPAGSGKGNGPSEISGEAIGTATRTSSRVSWQFDRKVQAADGKSPIEWTVGVYDSSGNLEQVTFTGVTAVHQSSVAPPWQIEEDPIPGHDDLSGTVTATTVSTGKLKVTFTGADGSPNTAETVLTFLGGVIIFEKVGDNWEIEDNKNADGKWMAGRGKRVFVDAKSPQETAFRDLVYVKVEQLPPEMKIRLKVFDVDDPSPDPDRVIDSNDTAAGVTRGDDNCGSQPPQCFEAGGSVTVDCVADANGVAKINGEMPQLRIHHHPGDNVRVAMIYLNPDGSPMEGQNLDVIQVSGSSTPGYLPPSGKVDEFNGVLSPLLTVWRKLNVEIDSMTAVATDGDEKNFEEGTVTAATHDAASGNSTITLNMRLTGQKDRYENGRLVINGIAYKIKTNTDNWIDGDQVVVKNGPGTEVVGQTFKIYDDDDNFLTELGLGAPLPRNTYHAATIAGIRPAFAPAYIQLEDANELGFNSNQTIPFKRNQAVGVNDGYSAARDITDKVEFWAVTLVFGYQSKPSSDCDPDNEPFLNPTSATDGV